MILLGVVSKLGQFSSLGIASVHSAVLMSAWQEAVPNMRMNSLRAV